MYRYEGMHSSVARAAQIRRTHDMEATELDSMRRSYERNENRVRTSLFARLLRRTRVPTQALETRQPPAVEHLPSQTTSTVEPAH